MTYGIIPDWYNGSQQVSENGYATELITEEAVEYLSNGAGKEKPFFLYLAYNAPHFGKGYSPSEAKPVNLMQPQAAELKRASFIEDKIRREFAAMTISLDDGIGTVLKALDDNQLSGNTLVIFLTDHGGDPTYGGSNLPLRGKKATLFEGGIRVPCLMRWPGKVKAGSVEDAPFSALDLFPTFCEMAQVDPGAEDLFDGVSLLPALTGSEAAKAERSFLWQTGSHAELGRESWLAYRRGNWKYVNSPQDGEFLFRIDQDPNETTNLKSENPEEFEALKSGAESKAEALRPRERD
jgi:arylsulfatase A-like enzyme